MTDMDFQQELLRFKANESAMAVALVEQDKDLATLVAAWGQVPVTNISPPPGVEALDPWARLWSQVAVDMRALAEATGLRRPQETLAKAKANRIVYPDGTINQHVGNFLMARALRQELRG